MLNRALVVLAVALGYAITHTFLINFSLHVLFITMLIFFVVDRFQRKLGSSNLKRINIFILTVVVEFLIVSTGATKSPFFFLYYITILYSSNIPNDKNIPLILASSIVASLTLVKEVDFSVYNLISLLSLFIFAIFSILFHKSKYRRNISQENLKCKIGKIKNKIINCNSYEELDLIYKEIENLENYILANENKTNSAD